MKKRRRLVPNALAPFRRLSEEDPALSTDCFDAKISLLFTTDHRRGALATCLQGFAEEDINLCKLESRHLADSPWEYLFYVDIEGNAEDPRLAAALRNLEQHTNFLRVLGCYPNRAEDE